MTLAFLNLSWPVFADALALGSIYALMAVGIGLVFGVLRLVNFAYGQLMMAGAFALAYGSQWGLANWESILFCLGVVLALSLLMDRLVFRPLRGHSPAVMLVATFAVAFILQNVALIAFGSLGKTAGALGQLQAPWDIFGVEIRKIAIIAIATAAVCLALLQFLLTRTSVGLHMRAASMDFRTARMLGVRANRVITGAVLISGLLAGIAAVMLSVRADTDHEHVRLAGDDLRARWESSSAGSTGRFRPRSAASRSASPSACSAGSCPRTRASTCPASSSPQ